MIDISALALGFSLGVCAWFAFHFAVIRPRTIRWEQYNAEIKAWIAYVQKDGLLEGSYAPRHPDGQIYTAFAIERIDGKLCLHQILRMRKYPRRFTPGRELAIDYAPPEAPTRAIIGAPR